MTCLLIELAKHAPWIYSGNGLQSWLPDVRHGKEIAHQCNAGAGNSIPARQSSFSGSRHSAAVKPASLKSGSRLSPPKHDEIFPVSCDCLKFLGFCLNSSFCVGEDTALWHVTQTFFRMERNWRDKSGNWLSAAVAV